MKILRNLWLALLALAAVGMVTSMPAASGAG
jgi:hypothetical protein